MKTIFRLVIFLLAFLGAMNSVFAVGYDVMVRSIALDIEYAKRCDGRCRGDRQPGDSCWAITDQNTCLNRYIFKTYTIERHPYTCTWGTSRRDDTPHCGLIDSGIGSEGCKCNKTYANPSKGIPDIRQRCGSGRVNYQGLCYIPCDRSYEMRSAGICTVKGL